MKRVVLLHGNGGGSGSDNWFPYIKKSLEEAGVVCEAPNLPDPIMARAEFWLLYIKDVIKADENTILVGHSSGAIAAMRYAETSRLAGTVIVGGYYTDLGYEDEKQSGYFDTPWNWEAIKNNQEWTAVFASTNDPFIPIEEPRFVKEQLGSEYFEFNDQGHFGEPDRVQEKFPELLEFLKRKIGILDPSTYQV